MIVYQSGGIYFLLKLLQYRGSVFPHAFAIALPAGICAALLKWLTLSGHELIGFAAGAKITTDGTSWSGFNFFVGFLIVFRTSEAHNRFWEGCTSTHHMMAEWFDACSSITAFTKLCECDERTKEEFLGILIRLFSMLHAAALADIEDTGNIGSCDAEAYSYELVDVGGIDMQSLRTLQHSRVKVQLIFQWIQQLIVEAIRAKVLSIPPPILSRAFQELATGMIQFHEAMKLSSIPFPFPYAQTCDWLLVIHWILIPFVMQQWVTTIVAAGLFSFCQVFTLWSLNLIAVQIENPFGSDVNDLDTQMMQEEFNAHLLNLLRPTTLRTPKLSKMAIELKSVIIEKPEKTALQRGVSWTGARQTLATAKSKQNGENIEDNSDEPAGSFRQIWKALEGRGRERWLSDASRHSSHGGDDDVGLSSLSPGSVSRNALPSQARRSRQSRHSRPLEAMSWQISPDASSPLSKCDNDTESMHVQASRPSPRQSLRSVGTVATAHQRRLSTTSKKSIFSSVMSKKGSARAGTQTWNQGGVWRCGVGLDVDSGCGDDTSEADAIQDESAGDPVERADATPPNSGGSPLVRFALPNGGDSVQVSVQEPFKSFIWESPSECFEPQPLMPVPSGQTPPVAESPRPPNDPDFVEGAQVKPKPLPPVSIMRRGASHQSV